LLTLLKLILRRHLEYVSRHLAHQLGASTVFRADGGYELNDLLPPVLSRMKTLCGKAADAAQSWGDTSRARRTRKNWTPFFLIT
jgi:hypothetical protein